MPPNEIKKKVDELAELAESKLGVAKEEVYEQFANELALMSELRSDMSDDDQAKRAFLRLRGTWKRELRSPALFYEGMLIRVATPFDVIRSMHAAAKTMYDKNPSKAVAEGLTNAEGVALDNRKKYSTGRDNPEYGKSLPANRFIQNIMGIAKSSDMAEPRVFTMVLSERTAGKTHTPIFTPIKFRANPARTQPTDGTMALNEYSNLKFRPTEIDGFPGPEAVVEQYFSEHAVGVEDLAEWHKQNASNPRRMAVLDGYVDYVDSTPNQSTENLRVTMVDDSGDVEVTIWVPEHLRHLIDFGPSSRVIVIGRTAQNTFNEELRTMVNCEGLYAPPKDKVPLEEAPESVVSGAEEVN